MVFLVVAPPEELQKQLVEQVELRKKLEREFQHLKGKASIHVLIYSCSVHAGECLCERKDFHTQFSWMKWKYIYNNIIYIIQSV